MSYQRTVTNKLGLPIAGIAAGIIAMFSQRRKPTPGYGLLLPKRHSVRLRPIAVVRAGVVNACYAASTVLHFAKLDARKRLHSV